MVKNKFGHTGHCPASKTARTNKINNNKG